MAARTAFLIPLAAAVTSFASCMHPKGLTSTDHINHYLEGSDGMKQRSHVLFMVDKAKEDYQNNAPVFSAGYKNVYIDKKGTTVSTRDRRLLYWEGRTFEILRRRVKFGQDGYDYVTPIVFRDQADDGKCLSELDQRNRQVFANNTNKNDSFLPEVKTSFTVLGNDLIGERVTLSQTQSIHYEFLYDMNKEMIFGRCPGSRTLDVIGAFKDVGPAMLDHVQRAQKFQTDNPTSNKTLIDLSGYKWGK